MKIACLPYKPTKKPIKHAFVKCEKETWRPYARQLWPTKEVLSSSCLEPIVSGLACQCFDTGYKP